MPFANNQKTILITGATSGIGLAAAKLFAGKGNRVIIHGRDEKSACSTCTQINKPDLIIPVWGDLADLSQVRELVKQIVDNAPVPDVVILNAGVFQTGDLHSRDGFELDFAVNYHSHLLMVHLLIERKHVASDARIIFVSSSAYINGDIDIDKLGIQHLNDPMRAYATSKQLCLVAALELARRLSETEISVNACNPGPTATRLLAAGKGYGWASSGSPLLKAARRLEWLALSPELKGSSGHYFNDRSTPNVPKRIRNEKTTAAIYEKSMRLCNAKELIIRR